MYPLQVFNQCLKGQRALIIVEGAVGREEFASYILKYPHQIGAWSQV